MVLLDALEVLDCSYFLVANREVLVDSIGECVVWLGWHWCSNCQKGQEEDERVAHINR
jgi:hypothetical protein